jgi:hypothetical protein
VCDQVWLVAAAPNGSRRNDFPHKRARSNQDPAAEARGRSTSGHYTVKPDTWRAAGAGHSDVLLAPDVRALDVPKEDGNANT